MPAYYNEIDPFEVELLYKLMEMKKIAPGLVDSRSIEDVEPEDLKEFEQCHFFAGIGVWSYALKQAGVPDTYPVWTGSCPCFPRDTYILTKEGQKPIQDIKVGDLVLTHKGRWRKVTQTGSDPNKRLVKLKGQGHSGLRCTPNHPFLTGEEEWTWAEDLAGNRWRTVAFVPDMEIPNPCLDSGGVNYIGGAWKAVGSKENKTVYLGRFKTKEEARARRLKAIKTSEIIVKGACAADYRSVEFARFLGFWVGNGWTTGNTVTICDGKTDENLVKEILMEANIKFNESYERTSFKARFGSKPLAQWLRIYFGKGAENKFIPTWLHGTSKEYRDSFLKGYMEADGYYNESASTTSHKLMIGLRILFNQARRAVCVTYNKRVRQCEIEGRIVNELPYYKLEISDTSRSFQFSKLHGIGLVRSIEPAGVERVYNISVEKDESYVAEGIAVHNCPPFSNAGKKKRCPACGGKPVCHALRTGVFRCTSCGHDWLADGRHLWPEFYRLIVGCRPGLVFGEQVAGRDGEAWLDIVQATLGVEGYTSGATSMAACGVGSPQQRKRLYWVAHTEGDGGGRKYRAETGANGTAEGARQKASGVSGNRDGCSAPDSVAHADSNGCREEGPGVAKDGRDGAERNGPTGGMANTSSKGLPACECQELPGAVGNDQRGATEQCGRSLDEGLPGPTNGFWRDADWLGCRDGKWRPTKPGAFPLVDGAPSELVCSGDLGPQDASATKEAWRVRLRGYGNAIVAQQAIEFIKAFIKYIN